MQDNNNKNHIANILNITPTIKENDLIIHQNTDTVGSEELNDDINYVRDMMYDTIKNTSEAVTQMLEIAKVSQHPRAFEVVSTLLNTQREASKDLLELHKKKKELKHEDKDSPDTINNNLFVGSTAELLKMIRGQDLGKD